MPKFDVTELSQGDDCVQWDELVAQSPHGTIFHTSGWLDACARSLGKKVKIFGCFQNGQLVGGCSLFLEKKYGIIPLADSVCTMTPYGGFVLSQAPCSGVHKQDVFSQRIIESLTNEIEKENFFSISMTNSPEFLDIRPFTWNGWESHVYYTYYVNLENSPELHSDRMARKNIRKAEKNQIIIEPFSDISHYYSMLSETFARKNLTPPASKRLICELYAFIRKTNCGEMLGARTTDDKIASARIIIWDTRKAYGWSAASDSRYLNSGSTYLLRLETLNRLNERGIKKMNLMMANVPELSESAVHFNPTLVPYYQVQKRIFNNFPIH